MSEILRVRIFKKPYFDRSFSLILKILLKRGRKPLLIVFGILLFYFVILQILEGWTIVDTLWFLIATISTVGYGDKVPVDDFGRVLVIILILISLGTIATLSTLLFETIQLVSKPQFWNEHQIEEVSYHVIIVGNNNLSTIIADNFLEIGVTPVIVDGELNKEIVTNYLSIIGEIRSAETYVKAKIEENCIGIIITTRDDTNKINAAIAIRSLDKLIPVIVLLEIRKRIELTRPLPATVFSDLNLTVIDPAELLAKEISKYLHLGRLNKALKDFSCLKTNKDVVFEFPADTFNFPAEVLDYISEGELNLNLIGYSKKGTSDFSLGFPTNAEDVSHLLITGSEEEMESFRRSFCSIQHPYKLPKTTLFLGFGETSKILLPVMTETETEITVLDIHQEKILEAQNYKIDHVIMGDFFEIFGLQTKKSFDFEFCIINMPKILSMAALARIRVISPNTKTVVTVNDSIDAPYFYSHGASVVLVRSQLTAEAAVHTFFPKTHFFGNGLIEFLEGIPVHISSSKLEHNLKGKILAIYPPDEELAPMFYPFGTKHGIDAEDNVLFFHEAVKIKRARYGH